MEDYLVVEEAGHQRPHNVWFHLCEVPRLGKSIDTESRLMVAQNWEMEVGVGCEY